MITDMNNSIRFIVPQNKREYGYVGFDIEADHSKFIFPCQYLPDTASESLCKSEAKKIISLIKTVQKDYFLGDSHNETSRFYSMMWLVRDFLEKGYYMEMERIIKKSENGKIHWKKTIKNNSIYFEDGNIIYKTFFRYKNTLNTGNLLTQIYKFCLYYSVKQVGFLYGVNETEKSVFKDCSDEINFMCHILKKEFSSTHNSYKKMLINHLLTILKGMQGKTKAISLCMRDEEFEYVFECLVNSVFGTEDVKLYYNQCSYIIGEANHRASKLRPDTVMKNPLERTPSFFVIDAKYYNYGYTGIPGDLPQSSSITKQIGYNHYLEDKMKESGETFYSVFLLPYSGEKNKQRIEYVGYAKAETDTPSVFENKVAVCLVDLKTLVDTYFGVGTSKQALQKELAELVIQRCFAPKQSLPKNSD